MIGTDIFKLAGKLCEEAYTSNDRVDLGTTEYLARVIEYHGFAAQALTIPGTDEPLDWIKNFDLRSIRGIKRSAYEEAEEIHGVFKPMKGVKLFVFGHSKGGAAALAYSKIYGADYCVAFCPARCFRYTIDRHIKNATIFMDHNDIVPKLGRFTFGHPICNWLYLPDDFPGIKISDHFMDHVNEFLDKAYAPTWCDIN